MKRQLALGLVALLILGAVPALGSGTGPKAIHGNTSVPGDVYVIKLRPENDAGPGFRLLSNSTITVTGDHAPKREDSGHLLGFTDRFAYAFLFATYAHASSSNEQHLEVLTNEPIGVQVDMNTPTGPFGPSVVHWSFPNGVSFPNKEDTYLFVAVPEAVSTRVVLDLHFNKKVTLVSSGQASTGLAAASEDFDGVAQYSRERYTVGALMEARADAPAGTNAFSILFPFEPTLGAGHFQIAGPGGTSEGYQLGSGGGERSPLAFVAVGQPGTYLHQVSGIAQLADPGWPSGYAALFTAVPMPLPG